MEFIWVLTLVGIAGIPAATAAVLYRGAMAAALGRDRAVRVAAATLVGWGAWIALSFALARVGFFRQDPEAANPWIPVFLIVALTGALLATRIPVVATILAAPGMAARLVLPQAFRVVGLTFLVAMALGRLPAVFSLPAGLGDIAVGLTAPLVAWRLLRDTGRGSAIRFHVLGIVDLVVALGLGVLAGLGPARLLMVEPSTLEVSLLPLVLIPTTAVPLAIALHVVALRLLRRDQAGLVGDHDQLRPVARA